MAGSCQGEKTSETDKNGYFEVNLGKCFALIIPHTAAVKRRSSYRLLYAVVPYTIFIIIVLPHITNMAAGTFGVSANY